MVAIIFPWAIIFADDNPLGGVLALALQATLIGWLPASIWAWKIVHREPEALNNTEQPQKPTPKKPKSAPSAKDSK